MTFFCIVRAKFYMCFCASPSLSCSIHVAPICRLSESFPSLVIGNSLLTNAQLLCELFLCLWIIFIQQCLQFHIFVLFGRFSVFLVCNIEISNFETLKSSFTRFFAMEHVHHKLLQVIGVIPQQFSSNENKKLMLRECSLFGTNFVILNTATQYYANTFQSNHFARLTLVVQ